MQISPVSFGKKIPRSQVNIRNNQTGEFEPATFYEMNCKDEQDYMEVRNLGRKWYFSTRIADDMRTKYEVWDILHQRTDDSFYVIENKEKEIVGTAEVSSTNGVYDVSFLESVPGNKYKYIGQSMLAAIGNEVLKKDGLRLIITTAIDEAMDFYTKVCGFELYGSMMLKMSHKQLENFMNEVANKTQSPVIDIKG